jgi:hypothetical protein
MSDLEFSAPSTDGEVFEAVDPSRLFERAGFAAAVEAGLADRQQMTDMSGPLPIPPEPSPSSRASVRDRQARLLDALDGLREAVEVQTSEEAEVVYQAFDAPFQASRGRQLER